MNKDISIVVPVYNEAESVDELVQSITLAMNGKKFLYEIILINDGSKDNSWERIKSISQNNVNVIGINLAGNYGQTIALKAGFDTASGEIIIAMDGDLQHDPKYIPVFVEEMIAGGYDMIGGAKINRPGSRLNGLLANLAHFVIQKISGVKLNYFGATFKAYRSYLLKDINMLGDVHRFLGALVARKGTVYKEISIEIHERKHGKSNYNFQKIFLVIVDLIFLKFLISYLHKPFRLIGVFGLLNLILGFISSSAFIIGSLIFEFNIRKDYLIEFIFSTSLVLVGGIFLALGIIAELLVQNKFQSNFQAPYKIRAVSHKDKAVSAIVRTSNLVGLQQ